MFDPPKIQSNPQNWWVSNQGEAEFPRTPLNLGCFFGGGVMLDDRCLNPISAPLAADNSRGSWSENPEARNDAIALVFQSTLASLNCVFDIRSMIYVFLYPKSVGLVS